MSAFMCDPEVIALLVHGAERPGRPHCGGLRWHYEAPAHEGEDYVRRELPIGAGAGHAQFVFDMLVTENMRSIMARYPDTVNAAGEPIVDEMPGPIGADWSYRPTRAVRDASWVDVLKACSCYEYQACETVDWPDSEAHAFIVALRGKAISNLPGYEASRWWK